MTTDIKALIAELGRLLNFVNANADRWHQMTVEEKDEAKSAMMALNTACNADTVSSLLDHIEGLEREIAEARKLKPIKLSHMAFAEDGVLRWSPGRKIKDCELYAMPDWGRAPELFAALAEQGETR